MIPKEAEGESFEDALARVRRCLRGGATAEDEDGDSDLEVVADSVTVNLRCPVSCVSSSVVRNMFTIGLYMYAYNLQLFS